MNEAPTVTVAIYLGLYWRILHVGAYVVSLDNALIDASTNHIKSFTE
jgi:hypothetical protein